MSRTSENSVDKPSPDERMQAEKACETIAALSALNNDYTLTDVFGPDAAALVQIGILASKEAKHVPPITCRAGDLFSLLSTPLDLSKARLPLFLPATLLHHHELRARRNAANVGRIDFVVLDYDKGDALASVLIERAGEVLPDVSCLAYRTPSDGADETSLMRFDQRGKELCAATVEAVTAKLMAQGYKPDVLGAITVVDACKTEKETKSFRNKNGQWEKKEIVRKKILIRHKPLSKSRLVIHIKDSFTRRDGEKLSAFERRWNDDVLTPLIHALGFAADPSCSDVCRAFYVASSLMPSRATDVVHFVKGAALGLDGDLMRQLRKQCAPTIKAEKAAAQKRKKVRQEQRASTGTPTGRFMLADAVADLAPDRVRNDLREAKDGLLVCECPYDELHSNCGDPTDSAFWVTNNGSAGCKHSHMDEHDAEDYVAKMLADNWFTAEQLAAYAIRKRLTLDEKMTTDAAYAFKVRAAVEKGFVW